jgi:FkbM family methyltransferase
MGELRSRLFIAVALAARTLPPFRGRSRALLLLFRALGLSGKHVLVTTRMTLPVAFKARLDLHSWLQRIGFLTGRYEDRTIQFLAGLHESVGADGYILDVGANIGLISVPLAMLTGGPIVAVEAVTDNVLALRQNIALNALEQQIAVVAAALGDEPKTVDIQVEGDLEEGGGTGTANILPAGSTYRCVRQALTVDTIDNLWRKGTIPARCAVMKIDTDGYDLNILRGAREFIRSERPMIYGEFSAHCLGWHGQSVVDVIAFAQDNGYVAWQRNSPSWTFSARIDPITFVQDLLLVPDGVEMSAGGVTQR